MSYLNNIRFANLSKGQKYFKWQFFTKPFDLFAWLREEHSVYDCDGCGEKTTYYVLVDRDGIKFYRLTHEWGWNNYDSEEDRELCNEFTWQEVGKEDLDKYAAECLKFVV